MPRYLVKHYLHVSVKVFFWVTLTQQTLGKANCSPYGESASSNQLKPLIKQRLISCEQEGTLTADSFQTHGNSASFLGRQHPGLHCSEMCLSVGYQYTHLVGFVSPRNSNTEPKSITLIEKSRLHWWADFRVRELTEREGLALAWPLRWARHMGQRWRPRLQISLKQILFSFVIF